MMQNCLDLQMLEQAKCLGRYYLNAMRFLYLCFASNFERLSDQLANSTVLTKRF